MVGLDQVEGGMGGIVIRLGGPIAFPRFLKIGHRLLEALRIPIRFAPLHRGIGEQR